MAAFLPTNILRFLMLRTPTKRAIDFSPEDKYISALYNDFDTTKLTAFTDTSDTGLLARSIISVSEPNVQFSTSSPDFVLAFSALKTLAQLPHINIFELSEHEKGSPLTPNEQRLLNERLNSVNFWLRHYATEDDIFSIQTSLHSSFYQKATALQCGFLRLLLKALTQNPYPSSSEKFQNLLFTTARLTPLPAKDAFKAIYLAFLNKEKGPLAGNLLFYLNPDTIFKLLSTVHVNETEFLTQSSTSQDNFLATLTKEAQSISSLRFQHQPFSLDIIIQPTDGRIKLARIASTQPNINASRNIHLIESELRGTISKLFPHIQITKVVTNSHGELDKQVIATLASLIAPFTHTHHIIIVTSGAVACGKRFISQHKSSLLSKRTAASIGNIELFSEYAYVFQNRNITIAQALLERKHFSNRTSFLNLRDVFIHLWNNSVIPIVNENDVVSDYELKFSDNDELAMLLAICFSAEFLFLGTTVNGVLDSQNQTIPEITTFDESIYHHVHSFKGESVSSVGLGGMISKLQCAKIACSMGTKVAIFNAKETKQLSPNSLAHWHGTSFAPTATTCYSYKKSISPKRRWIAAASKGIVTSKLFIDAHAFQSLSQRKSLLLVGVKKIIGDFQKNDYVRLFSIHDEQEIGAARIKSSSDELRNKQKTTHLNPTSNKDILVAHADEIIIY
ncbi:hypothetical protein CHS0354_023813 [Potamilus streckersoni]|uniref:Glutamate 5-kinase n=1 Tax=Potamilus streckersoni TaxID=2493646 RepID=A0AAE0RZE4_9BIVA|nr:hypothetical protein CHS0354_023813 [Potamilus streckersoni]